MPGSMKGPLEFSVRNLKEALARPCGEGIRKGMGSVSLLPQLDLAPLVRLSHLGMKRPGSLYWPFPSQSQKVWERPEGSASSSSPSGPQN